MLRNFFNLPRAGLLAAAILTAGAALLFAQTPVPRGPGSPAPDIVSAPGVLVGAVFSGSPAEKAGISRGDIVLSADGKDVNTVPDLVQAVEARKAGDTLSLRIKHGDAERTLKLALAERNARPYLGILPYAPQFVRNEAQESRGLPPRNGASVVRVLPGSPAEKAGVKAADLIVSADGVMVGPQNDLSALIAKHKVGDTVTLSVVTAGQPARDITVILEKNPQKPDSPYLGIEYGRPRGFSMMPGFSRGMLGPFGREGFGPGAGGNIIQGTIVDAVSDNSPAAKAGIKARDIITAVDGTAVISPRGLVDALSKRKPGDAVTVTVYRFNDGKSVQIKVTLGQAPQGSGSQGNAAASGAFLGATVSRFMGWEGPDGERTLPLAPGPREALPPGMPLLRLDPQAPNPPVQASEA